MTMKQNKGRKARKFKITENVSYPLGFFTGKGFVMFVDKDGHEYGLVECIIK